MQLTVLGYFQKTGLNTSFDDQRVTVVQANCGSQFLIFRRQLVAPDNFSQIIDRWIGSKGEISSNV